MVNRWWWWRGGRHGYPSIRHRDWRDEPIAAASISDDVAVAVLPVAQRLSQLCDVDPQIGLLDEHVRPYQGHQFVLAHQFSGALHQDDQDIHRPAAQCDWCQTVTQKLLSGMQFKRAELDRPPGSRGPIHCHDVIPLDGDDAAAG